MSKKRTRGSEERFEDGVRNLSLIMKSLGRKEAEMKENLPATVFNNQDTKDGKTNGETDEDSDSEDVSDTEMDNDLSSMNNIDVMDEPAEKERSKRGPTRMASLWKDHDADNKINLKFNRFGQPCGLKTCKLTSFIGTLVKGKEISLAANNWSRVPKSDKEKLWLTVQAFFNVDESFKPWVLRSASKKWKDFKVVLKRKYFNRKLTRKQNTRNGCGKRIPDPQWEWLVRHWKTSASQAKSEKNKAIRAIQLNGTHSSGSRSFAVTLDQLEMKEGRQVGRAELYIATHTKKNGEPVDKYSGDNIKEIRRQFAANPSLIGEEARDGDVFSGLFPKERSGRWRGLGLLVGGQASMQLAEVKAELQESRNENLRLWSVIKTLEKNQSVLEDQHNELKAILLASHGHKNAGSSPKIVEETEEGLEDMVDIDNEEKEAPTSSRGSKRTKVKTEHVEKKSVSTQQIPKKGQPTHQGEKATLSLQQNRKSTLSDKNLLKKPRKFQTPLQKGGMTVFKRGLEVGLISPQSTSMVAFATIQATDSKSKATDGQPLGDCVEVLINTCFSKTTLLPRSQGNISKLANAVGKCIQWPRKNVEPLNDGSGDVPTHKVSVSGAHKENSSKRSKVKNSSSIASPGQPISTMCT